MYTIFGDNMKDRIKKIVTPIFLSVLCGAVCGRVMFSIYEDKESSVLDSDVVYLLEDDSYDDYDSMKANVISSNYVYYEEDGKYRAVVAMTKNKNNIDKIKKVYGKRLTIHEYLISDNDINDKLEEYDIKIEKANSDDDIKDIVMDMISLYKREDNLKMVKIS